MLIRFVRSWRRFAPGDCIDMPDGAANVLIKRHIATMDDAAPAPEAAVSAPANVERAVKPAGRPNKWRR